MQAWTGVLLAKHVFPALYYAGGHTRYAIYQIYRYYSVTRLTDTMYNQSYSMHSILYIGINI